METCKHPREVISHGTRRHNPSNEGKMKERTIYEELWKRGVGFSKDRERGERGELEIPRSNVPIQQEGIPFFFF